MDQLSDEVRISLSNCIESLIQGSKKLQRVDLFRYVCSTEEAVSFLQAICNSESINTLIELPMLHGSVLVKDEVVELLC